VEALEFAQRLLDRQPADVGVRQLRDELADEAAARPRSGSPR
jgi:hypothetical protein